MDVILEQFLGEARENLSYLDQNLDQLSENDPEVVNALFRAAHTLKGGAGLVGLDGIKTLTHHAEDLLDGIKKGSIEYSDDMLDVLYDSFDEAVEMVDAAEEIGGIPEYDIDKIESISKSVEALIKKDDDEIDNDGGITTELNIILDEDVIIGDLINTRNIDKFIKDLSITNNINQSFIENENIYLIDIDLEEDTCSYGNDPIYLIYLLDEDNILSINTYLYIDCEDKEVDKTLWKTRVTLVVKSDETGMEDAFYNIMDDISIYPLSIKSLLTTQKESMVNDIFEDFIKDFKEMSLENNFSELNEKISAIIKVLNPESKESFILERALLILSNLEFDSLDYLEMVKYISFRLGVKEEENDIEEEIIEKLDDVKYDEASSIEVLELTPERLNAINILKQQIKVLECSGDDASLSRVKLFVRRALDYIDVEHNFEIDETSESLFTKILEYIGEIDPKNDILNMTFKEKCNIIEDKKDNNTEEITTDNTLDNEVVKDIKKDIKDEQVTTNNIDVKKEDIKEKQPIVEEKRNPVKEKAVVGHTAVPKTVKIEQSDIDSMMDIIGELLVMKNSLPYVANNIKLDNIDNSKAELMAKYEEISRVTDILQDKIMGMRLLPMSYIFSRYPKLIRDISKVLDKKIRFEESGGETKLDKMMIEKIADPLVHIIRNSLDHGIEPTSEDRIEAGKDPVGYIKVSAKSIGD
ncbi:MAG: Hpt domain-containing protein, partial [Campylobacterota bacterium]|nr:Hpt domain-containing protein [Campylobacterota bacterium]